MSAIEAARDSAPAAAVRDAARRGELTGPTAGLAPGFTQANLVVLPQADAYDFLLFCTRNPRPCPLLEVTDAGSPEPAQAAPGADLRTDLPRYRVLRGQITTRYPAVHGAPLHVGDPAALGIVDLDAPDYGDPVQMREGEVPVFWACGVTPQAVAAASRPELMVTHAPGHMFVTDLPDARLAAL